MNKKSMVIFGLLALVAAFAAYGQTTMPAGDFTWDKTEGGGVVIAGYVGQSQSVNIPASVTSIGAAAASEPGWTRRPPRIAGYRTAAGFAGARRHIQETVFRSYKSAAGALISDQSIRMETLDKNAPGREAASRITGTAEGILQGFVVLEIWIDPTTKGVWTLAAARETL